MAKPVIGVIGYGNVGRSLGRKWQETGYDVTFGVRDMESPKVKSFQDENPELSVAPLAEVLEGCDIIALVTPFDAAKKLAAQNAATINGKVVIDCTNPISKEMKLIGSVDTSGAEEIAKQAPEAHIVKCFNSLGWENFENPAYPGYGSLKPIMFLCGNDEAANAKVADIAEAMGFDPCIAGDLGMAHYLEAWAMVWIMMGRAQGKGSDFAFAMLKR